ncbi:hypothetical protein [Bradyrhizobium sp. DASA03120]|uniref:hypothetical protein n=1 Tax=Bradyrhizobium sp. SMVTL-02 TaxID=3395917 RepID=UPI003F70C3CD
MPENMLWWEGDTGCLYVRYNVGDSVQWLLMMPLPDVSSFVQTGDTMTAALKVIAPVAPTMRSEDVVDAAAAGSVRYCATGADHHTSR